MSQAAAVKSSQCWERQSHVDALKSTDVDLLVIGGGASGAGVALDALSRGLTVALVDRQDFMAGTSSRSTKLIHGGVRYLEQAFKSFDYGKYQLVKEALHERKRMLKMAPHLAWPLTLITPVKNPIGLLYYRFGLGLYDILAGSERLGKSRIESKDELSRACPSLDLKPLKGGVSYMDGQFDDARFGIAMVRSAVEQGAHVLNYTKVDELILSDDRVSGARCTDELSGEVLNINARVVVNCTGPWTDKIRTMADPAAKPMMTVSSGIHISFNKNLLPDGRGILVPETDDGRVLFILPWLGKTLVGTTDDPANLSDTPTATDDDIDYIIKHVNEWLAEPLSRDDISATFSGLRPLVSNPSESSTGGLSRDHVIINEKGMVTLTGGKWTTWRNMAEDCVNEVVKSNPELKAGACNTYEIRLPGANGDKAAAEAALKGLPEDVATYLWQAYGDRAHLVLKQGSSDRLVDNQPYIKAELDWAIKFEGACKVDDVVYRRLRVGMLDEAATQSIRAQVASVLEADASETA
ncbi:MAG: FAD-dependent oxidoreductase [Oleiphilaceae bacterium]|nr:FAD-dependent oxidoreductase [Oleiphilaceae bacterium]